MRIYILAFTTILFACSAGPSDQLPQILTTESLPGNHGVIPSDAGPGETLQCDLADGNFQTSPTCTLFDGATGQTVRCTLSDGNFAFDYCQ